MSLETTSIAYIFAKYFLHTFYFQLTNYWDQLCKSIQATFYWEASQEVVTILENYVTSRAKDWMFVSCPLPHQVHMLQPNPKCDGRRHGFREVIKSWRRGPHEWD